MTDITLLGTIDIYSLNSQQITTIHDSFNTISRLLHTYITQLNQPTIQYYNNSHSTHITSNQLAQCIQHLYNNNVLYVLYQYVLHQIKEYITRHTIPQYCTGLNLINIINSIQSIYLVYTNSCKLIYYITDMNANTCNTAINSLIQELQQHIHCHLFYSNHTLLCNQYDHVWSKYFNAMFDAMSDNTSNPTVEPEFRSLIQQLHELQCMPYIEQYWYTPLLQAITHKINQSIGIYDRSTLNDTIEWLKKCIVQWLCIVLNTRINTTLYKQYEIKLIQYCYNQYINIQCNELFDIIIDYPDSQTIINDIATALNMVYNSSIRTRFITQLNQQLNTRLLHVGANTNDILTTYLNTIRVLHCIDSTKQYLLYDDIITPIKQYLKSRSDCVYCIVQRMLGDINNTIDTDFATELELNVEQISRGELHNTNVIVGDDSDVDDDINEQWLPDQLPANWYIRKLQSNSTHHIQSIDVIGALIDIFGTTETIVNEYKIQLSHKLLQKTTFDTDKELTQIEFMKYRFGDISSIEQMLRDLESSRRINSQINSIIDTKHPINKQLLQSMESLIVSAEFWPSDTIDSISFKLPSILHEYTEQYSTEYCELKKPRILKWQHSLGCVELELSFDDGRTQQYNVTPLLASIMYYYIENSTSVLKCSEISELLDIDDRDELRIHAQYWFNNNVLHEQTIDPDDYQWSIIEYADQHNTTIQYNNNNNMNNNQRGNKQITDIIETYILGALNNTQSLSLHKLHNTMKLYQVDDMNYTLSNDELQLLLNKMCDNNVLSCSNGMYTRVKPVGN